MNNKTSPSGPTPAKVVRPHYDAAFKQSAVEPYRRHGSPITRTAQALGINPWALRDWIRAAEQYFADVDVLITPALAQVALPALVWSRRGWAANVLANSRYAPFAAPWNLAGWPAMVVPAGVHRSGLPLSVQLVARPGGEALLLSVAARLEALRPWTRTAPWSD